MQFPIDHDSDNADEMGPDSPSDAIEFDYLSDRKSLLFIQIWVLLFAVVVMVLSFLMGSDGNKTVYFPNSKIPLPDVCMSRRTLNIDCPGCGMTRSFISLSSGKLLQSLAFHPVGNLLLRDHCVSDSVSHRPNLSYYPRQEVNRNSTMGMDILFHRWSNDSSLGIPLSNALLLLRSTSIEI